MAQRGSNDRRKEKKKPKSTTGAGRTGRKMTYVAQVGEVELNETGHLPRWLFDGSFSPKIPAGAVRGDVTRQSFGLGLGPFYWYEDIGRNCVQCRNDFVFTAEEQKYWYETLQFSLYSLAIRCIACRRQRRSDVAIRQRVGDAAAATQADDASAEDWLEHAEAMAAQVQRLGVGQPDQIVSSARRARRLRRSWADPLYWEAVGQMLAGRTGKAEVAFEQFVSEAQAGTNGVPRRLLVDGEKRLAAIRATSV